MPATKLVISQSRWSSLRQEPPEQLYLFSLIAVCARPGFLFIGFDNVLFCHDTRISTRYTLYQQSVLWYHHVDGGQSFISYWQCAKQPQSPQSTIPGKAALHSIWLELECKSLSISLSLSCIFGDQLNRGNSVWSSWATKAGVIILTVLPHSPLSLAEKIMQKLAFAISCLATFQFKSENSTKLQDCVADKVPHNSPRMLLFLA